MAKRIERPVPKSPGSSLGTRLFVLSGAVVALSLAFAVILTTLVGRRVADNYLHTQLQRAGEVQSRLGAAELDQLYLHALTVSGDPNFVAYLVEAIASNDPLSLTDQLDERQRDLGFTFAIVLDPQGHIVVRTDQQGGSTEMAREEIFKAAAESGEAAADGLWARDDKLYYAVVVPLTSAGVLQGYLLVAYQIDDATAERLSSATATEVVFLLDSGQPGAAAKVAASSLEAEAAAEVPAVVAKMPGLLGGTAEAPVQMRAELARQRWLVQGKPLTGIGGRQIGQVFNLGSLDEALEPFERIQRTLAYVGLGAVLAALFASYFVARRLLEPIRELAVAADKAAGGEFDQSIDGSSGGAEVAQLATTFNTLLSELREKRDMQVYLSELSRTLPDQVEGVAALAEPPQQRTAALLGFELRGYARTVDLQVPPRFVLEKLAKDLRRLGQAIALQSGQIEAAVGHRVIASFEGSKRTERALSAAADIVAHGRELDAVVVLATGTLVSGSVTWQTKPSHGLIGEVVETLENLLRVARPGVVLMSKSSRDELAGVLALSKVTIQEHKSSISEQPLYSLSAEAASALASPELGATMELTSDGTMSRTTPPTITMTLSGLGPGSVLGDRFEILSQLGSGGMGVVYKARDRKLHEVIALKMLKHDAYQDAQGLERLKDELKLARRISHPNVLRTFDFGEAEGFPFISMEFVRGVTLKKLLDESGRLPLSAGLHIARQLCRGLQAAHAQAVLHRDIKPENIIIEATGNTKLMDFGIAQPIQRQRAGQSRDGSVVGTPYYLAPEQIEGIEPDVRADLYATGVVLFEIFTGELPFPATGSLMQIITRKLNEEPFKASIFWGDIPADLELLIMRCLERDREKRFANIGLLLKELEALRA